MDLLDFKVGDRVELHPATDAWMSGDKYGTVTMIGRSLIAIHMDRSDKTRRVHPTNIYRVLS